MVSLNGISGVNVQRLSLNPQNFKVRKDEYENLFDFDKQNAELKSQKSIGLTEGIGLLFKGAGKQVKDIVSSVVEHPIKTLTVVGTTTAGLMALPLIGIPTTVGGAALALGFAGLAAINGVKHTKEFIKNNSNEEYDKARENLKQIGGDSIDLAMSAPFVPKAIKEVKNFAKYGKININTSALSEIKSAKGLKGKLSVLKNADKEAHRAINYNKTTEAEIAKLADATDIEKADIEKYIKDYNVPKEQIPKVVLEQWAKERGVATKPTVRYQSLDKNTKGYASPSECKITLNDYGDNTVKISSNCNTERYQQISPARRNFAGQYKVDFKDIETGEVFSEIIDCKLVDDRSKLLKAYKNCSQEAQQILTTTHEREHIHQFARFYANGDKAKLGNLSPKAEQLYKQMASELEPLTAQESKFYRDMARYNPKRRTMLAYIAEPMEVQARLRESELLGTKKFQTLDKVFKQVNKTAIPEIDKNAFLMNSLRAQSASA